ncbi:formimidoylglutamase [Cellulophaga sp. E16_2]|uniref:formimidoylglutamase n=1 Tax=Cellulophaga sp. E16_2 TaxID=2789297 RepID=UPI001A91923B|nr:formimidoylglutamase [Cellulophaga sp. E16_2]MBO0591729.1 formimidoylglutamase [Cellulophaga sp. E16_2]
MLAYKKTPPELWSGRPSDQKLYLHEKVHCTSFKALKTHKNSKTIALLGYACDEGVKRNQGRIGAVNGPEAIRRSLGKFPNHLADETQLLDYGTLYCTNNDMEQAQVDLSKKIAALLSTNIFPIVIGGGHDVAYGHFKGLRKYLGAKKIGIINFDAHFDLRLNTAGNTSGTPFYQIAKECQKEGSVFNYMCLGIRKDANDKNLFETADSLNVKYLETTHFNMHYLEHVQLILMQFIEDVDYVYTTIDLDGFSSAYAPGVSAPSPMGFSPDIVLESLRVIIDSKKLISLDIAEMNPTYDIDGRTAKLAASLVHYVMHAI